MEDKLDRKIKGEVTISLIDRKSNEEQVIRKSSNLVLDSIYNVFLDHLSPWDLSRKELDAERITKSYGTSLKEIGIGSGHHVEGDVYSPLSPLPGWADSDGSWSKLESPISYKPIVYFENPSGLSTQFYAIFPENTANDIYITEAGLFLANGDIVAINTFRGFNKTIDFAIKINWELSFK